MHRKSHSHSALSTLLPTSSIPSLSSTSTSTSSRPSRLSSRTHAPPSTSRSRPGREDASMPSLPGLTDVMESSTLSTYSSSMGGSRSRGLDTRGEDLRIAEGGGGLRRSNTTNQLSRDSIISNKPSESRNPSFVLPTVKPKSSSGSGLKPSSTTTGISGLTRSRVVRTDWEKEREREGTIESVRRKEVMESSVNNRNRLVIPSSSTTTITESTQRSTSPISTPMKYSHSRSHSLSTTSLSEHEHSEDTPRSKRPARSRIEKEDEDSRRRRKKGEITRGGGESARKRREVKEEDLESRLRKVASLRTSHGSRMKVLANLERELGSIVPKRREDVIGDKLMRFLSANVHIPLLHLFNRNLAVIFTLSRPASRSITQALLDEVGVVLNLLQGLCMLDSRKDGCSAALGEEFVIEAMLDLLYHLSTTSSSLLSPTSTSAEHSQPALIQIQLIDSLYPILLASSTHVRRFSAADGLCTIQSLVVGDGVHSKVDVKEGGEGRREVKMKCAEFLIFWDMLMLEEAEKVEKDKERISERSSGLYSGRTSTRSETLMESPIPSSPFKQTRHSPTERPPPINSSTSSTVSMSSASSISAASSSTITQSTEQRNGIPLTCQQGDRVSSGGSTSSSSYDARRSSIASSSSIILRTPVGADTDRSLSSSDERLLRPCDGQPKTPRKERHSMAPGGMTGSANLGFLTPQTNRVSRSYGLPGDGRHSFADDQALLGRSAPGIPPSRSRDRPWGDSRKASSITLGAVIEEHGNATGDTPPRSSRSPDTTFGTDVDESMHSTLKEDQTPRRRTPVDVRPTEAGSTSSRVDSAVHMRGKSFGALAMASGIGLGLPGGPGGGGLTRSETARRISPLSTRTDDNRSIGETRMKKTSGGGMKKSATSMGLSGMAV